LSPGSKAPDPVTLGVIDECPALPESCFRGRSEAFRKERGMGEPTVQKKKVTMENCVIPFSRGNRLVAEKKEGLLYIHGKTS